MKELLYIQAGNTSNYIGTHFWNGQLEQSSSTSDHDEEQEPFVNHDISFREGLSLQGDETFCPRLLVFDHKNNFGSLAKYNDLYPSKLGTDDTDEEEDLWNGSVVEHKQEPLQKNRFQERLEIGEDALKDQEDLTTTKMEFWSDFNLMYYLPRTIQRLPTLPDWELGKGDWNYGQSQFERYDLDNSLMENDLRLFIEECNMFQGFQITFDTSTFGAFTLALIELLRDEFHKTSVLTFPVLSGVDPSSLDIENPALHNLALQDILCMRSLNEFLAQSVPLQSPSSWRKGPWSHYLDFDANDLYRASSVLAAHVDSATLPLRLTEGHDDMSDLCNHLNWVQNTRFSHLSGILPYTQDGGDLYGRTIDFWGLKSLQRSSPQLAQRNITRGLNIKQASSVETYFSTTDLREPYLSTRHLPAYILPQTYPRFFRAPFAPTKQNLRNADGTSSSSLSIPMISSLSTTPSTSRLFKSQLEFLQECIRRRLDIAGMPIDDLKELANELWMIHDGYSGHEDDIRGVNEDVLSEDEEFAE